MYLKLSAFISLHHFSCPSKTITGLKKERKSTQIFPTAFISHFFSIFVSIKPFTSKHRLTFKVKLSILFCCPEHRVADNWHRVSTVSVSARSVCCLKRGAAHFPSSSQERQTNQNQHGASPPLSFSLHKHTVRTAQSYTSDAFLT